MEKKEALIPVFDGEDYSMWKKRLIMFLKLKKCNECIARDKTTADKGDWDENDLKAINYIYSTITNKQLEYVHEKTTAYDIIKKFDELYLKESTALQIVCRNKLEKMKLENYSDTATFFSDFEKNVNELKSAGAKIGEKEKLEYMLNTLPNMYSYIGDLIDTLKEEDRTAAYVKNKIEIAEMKNNEVQGERKSNVFAAKRSNGGACFKCGKTGHFARDCHAVQDGVAHNGNSRNLPRGRGRGRGRGRYARGRGNFHQRQRGSAGEQQQQRGDSGEPANAWVATAHAAQSRNGTGNEINWLLDSGCSDHIINDDNYFENCISLNKPVDIYLGDGKPIKATKIGNVISYFNTFGKLNKVDMRNVYYAKNMSNNLISYGKIMEMNKIVSQGNITKIFDKENNLTAIAYKENKILKMKSILMNEKGNANTVNCNYSMSLKEKWHRRLGHVNFGYLSKLSKGQLVTGLPGEMEKEFIKCKTCIENKMHKLPFNNNRVKATDLLEIIHTDVCGPFKTVGLNGEKYFVSFIDDYSKIAKVYCIKSKDEVYDCLVQFINEAENFTEKRVKMLRCDNGKEYLNNKCYKFAKEKGIILNNCPPYVHELNGTAERFNRSIMDMGRCLLAEANIHKRFWPEIMPTAAYLKNRTLTNTIERKTPFEIFFKRKPNVENLRLYGSKVFVKKPEHRRESKFDKKAELGILIGYTDVGYRVLLNNKVIVARDVEIVEKDVKCIGFDDYCENKNNANESIYEDLNDDDDVFKDENEASVGNKDNDNLVELKVPRRSTREKKSPVRYPNDNVITTNSSLTGPSGRVRDVNTECIYVNYSSIDTPYTFEEAINSKESDSWQKAMNNEINSLDENRTWILVPRVEHVKILDVKWVYTRKSDGSCKARLVVLGYQQTDVIDDIYAPVAKTQTLKILFSFCCQFGLTIEQMDVITAFLNGYVSSEVYIRQPKGFEDGTERVCKLIKALYGLRESPRAWYECLDEFLIKLGFKRSKIDNCLYTHGKGENILYLLVYVDDLLICCKNQRKIENVKKLLSEKFRMKDLGKIKEYLGINVEYDNVKGYMKLSQTKYIESLAIKYQLEGSRLYNTPMETNLKLERTENCASDIKYRNLIGELSHISTKTRPDVDYSVNYLSRFQNGYGETHWKYAMRVLKYLYLTKDMQLNYERNENCETIDCFVDADWAGDVTDRKSTSGYVIRLFGNVIDWKSRKQKCVTKASTYAEYVALSEAVSEIKFVRELVKFFSIKLDDSVKMYEDNAGVVNIAKYGNLTKNSKHIEIHYHFVHESVKEKLIEVCKVDTDENIADVFTKALNREKFEKFRKLMKVA